MLMVSIFVNNASVYGGVRKDIDAIIGFLKPQFNLVVKGVLSMFLGTHYIVENDFIIMSANHKIVELAKKVDITKYKKQKIPIRPKELFYPDEKDVFFKDVASYM